MTDERPTTDIEQGRYDPAPPKSNRDDEVPTQGPGAHPVPLEPTPGGTPGSEGGHADDIRDVPDGSSRPSEG